MKHEIRSSLTFLALALSGGAATSLGGTACETTDPTEARIVNEFSATDDDPTVRWTIVKVWYRSTLFVDPIAPGETSETLRVATGSEPAYAILRKESIGAEAGMGVVVADAGMDGARPRGVLIAAARTRSLIEFAVGDQKTIALSPATLLIGCGGINGLSEADYELIRERIFPGDGLPVFGEMGCDGASTVVAPDASTEGDK